VQKMEEQKKRQQQICKIQLFIGSHQFQVPSYKWED